MSQRHTPTQRFTEYTSPRQERPVLSIKIPTERMIKNFRVRFACSRLWRTQFAKHDRFVTIALVTNLVE